MDPTPCDFSRFPFAQVSPHKYILAPLYTDVQYLPHRYQKNPFPIHNQTPGVFLLKTLLYHCTKRKKEKMT
jgi:hypothetical protein